MSEDFRGKIQTAAYQALTALNFGEPEKARVELYRILDALNSHEAIEHATFRSEPGRFQVMMFVG